MAAPRRRLLTIAVLLSVGVHLTVALLIVLLPRSTPPDAGPKEPATVTLLMVEKKGAGPIDAAAPADRHPTPLRPVKSPKTEPPKTEPQKTEPPKTELPKTEPPKTEPSKPVPPKPEPPKAATPAPKVISVPPTIDHDSETVPPPAEPPPPQPQPPKQDPQPTPKPIEAQPTPPRPRAAPVFNLSGTESESNAIAIGQGILPAMPDDRFRNKPPIYPIEAQLHNLHGTVVLVIHVSESGVATGVDVQQSSGVDMLDQAAIAAVRNWRFRPALQDGHAVPFDYPFRFIFEPR